MELVKDENIRQKNVINSPKLVLKISYQIIRFFKVGRLGENQVFEDEGVPIGMKMSDGLFFSFESSE